MKLKNKNIGLVLSGGGARAYAQIGALHALNEHGIFPSHIAGSSAGALVGALYCSGYSPLELLEIAKSQEFLKIFKIGFINKELTKMTRLRSFLKEYIKDDFKLLEVPLYVSVTNLNKGINEIKSSGNLIDIIAASCAIPLLFHPVKINETLYVDGGLLNNFPVEALLKISDKIIGISVNEHQFQENIKGVMQITERCLQLAVWNTVQERIKKCDAAIIIDQHYTYSMFSINKAEELFEIGYLAAMEEMEEILKIIG